MKISRILLFSSISLISFLLLSCQSARLNTDLPIGLTPYLMHSEDVVYDASFKFKDFHASGLLVMKRVSTDTFHIVLLSKFGVSLLEFKLQDDEIEWIKKFDQLEDSNVLGLIERDFRIILLADLTGNPEVNLRNSDRHQAKYIVKNELKLKMHLDKSANHVIYAENRGIINLVKTKVRFDYNDLKHPEIISLSHRLIPLDIKLKHINNNVD